MTLMSKRLPWVTSCLISLCVVCSGQAQTDIPHGGQSATSESTVDRRLDNAHKRQLTLKEIISAKSHEITSVRLEQTASWIWHKRGYGWDPLFSATMEWDRYSMPVITAAKKMSKERQQAVLAVVKQAMRECGVSSARVQFEAVTARIQVAGKRGFGIKGSAKVTRAEILRLNDEKSSVPNRDHNQDASNANRAYRQYRSWVVSRLPYAEIQGIQAHLLSSLFFTAWHKMYLPAPEEMPTDVQALTVESDHTKIPTVMVGGYLSVPLKRHATQTVKELMRLLSIPKSKIVFHNYNDKSRADSGAPLSGEQSEVVTLK